MFVGNVSGGGTLVYQRDVCVEAALAISLRKNCNFMVKAMRDGARLCPLPGRGIVCQATNTGYSPRDASLSRKTGRSRRSRTS